MTRLLLDTHVVPWKFEGGRITSLSAAQEAIEMATAPSFSVVSFTEIGVKAAVGKIWVPADLHEFVAGGGVQIFGLDAGHGLAVADLVHRQPARSSRRPR